MTDRRAELDAEVLPAQVVERLLRRAGELDAVRATGSAVAELRAAATEAGISAHAFDSALAELQQADRDAPPAPPASARRWRGLFIGLATVGAIVLALAMVWIPARLASRAPANMNRHTIQLNCLPADRAVELIRPLLTDPANTIVRPGNTTNIVIVRVTPEQWQSVRSAVDQVDNADACVRR